jgi:DNA-binding transcriptional ArsR family regulator
MRELMALTKALSDENRVRILHSLLTEELCVCQLIELLELAPSTVSKHLSLLRQARLVEARKDGRWMYYRLADPDAPKFVQDALGMVQDALCKDPRAKADTRRLKAILKLDPEVLCSQQRASATC